MNEEGGAATPPPPSEISLPIHTSRDVITNKSNENKKLVRESRVCFLSSSLVFEFNLFLLLMK